MIASQICKNSRALQLPGEVLPCSTREEGVGQAESPHQKNQPCGRFAGFIPSGAGAESPQKNREALVMGQIVRQAGLGMF